MRAYYSFNALMDRDKQCSEFIRIYGGQAGGLGKTLPRDGGAGGAAGGNRSCGRNQSCGRNRSCGKNRRCGWRYDRCGCRRKFRGNLGRPLAAAIERGLREEAHRAVTGLLETREPLDVINEVMIPALDRVGKGFEAGTSSFRSCS